MRRKVIAMTPTEYERDKGKDRYFIGSKEYTIDRYGKNVLGVFYHRGPKVLVSLTLNPIPRRKS